MALSFSLAVGLAVSAGLAQAAEFVETTRTGQADCSGSAVTGKGLSVADCHKSFGPGDAYTGQYKKMTCNSTHYATHFFAATDTTCSGTAATVTYTGLCNPATGGKTTCGKTEDAIVMEMFTAAGCNANKVYHSFLAKDYCTNQGSTSKKVVCEKGKAQEYTYSGSACAGTGNASYSNGGADSTCAGPLGTYAEYFKLGSGCSTTTTTTAGAGAGAGAGATPATAANSSSGNTTAKIASTASSARASIRGETLLVGAVMFVSVANQF